MSVINIEKFFSKIDDDNSGSITVAELNGLFKRFDKDGSNKLDRDEFRAGMAAELEATEEQADKTFKALDKDGDGTLDLAEIADFFKEMDNDGSGDINKDEFIAFWKKLLA